MYAFIKKGYPYPLAAFENRRSFLAVENLCFFLDQILMSSVPSGIYNVADDTALSTNEVIRIMNRINDSNPKLLKIPPVFIKSLAKIGDFLNLPLNSERLHKMTDSYVVSNRKIKEALGITKLPISSQQGLELTIKSLKEN